MSLFAVLVGHRDLGGVPRALAEAAAEITHTKPEWLAEGLAVEFAATERDAAPLEAALRAAIGAAPVDVAVLPAGRRRKRLLIADMDSTIIGCECIDELADFAGVKPQVADITERAMRGELDFPSALRHRVA